jgi:hypothetical protein
VSAEALETEARELTSGRFDDRGRPAAPGAGRTFDEVVYEQGMSTYLALPRQEEVFRWLRRGGRPEQLPSAQREALEAYDRAFLARGLAPPFEPFLASPPGRPLEEVPAELLRKPWSQEPGWDDVPLPLTAMVRFTEEHDAAVRAALERGERIEGGAVLVSRRPTPAVNVELSLLQAPGRRHLQERLAPGHVHLRAFFWAAFRALDEPGVPPPVQAKLLGLAWRFFVRTRTLLYPGWTSSHPDRLLGGRPTRAGSAFLRALVTTELQRRVRATFVRSVVAPGLRELVPHDEEVARWRVVVEWAEESPDQLPEALGTRAYLELLEVLVELDDPATLLAEHLAHGARWLRRATLEEVEKVGEHLRWARRRVRSAGGPDLEPEGGAPPLR